MRPFVGALSNRQAWHMFCIAMYSTDHWIGGTLALAVCVLFALSPDTEELR